MSPVAPPDGVLSRWFVLDALYLLGIPSQHISLLDGQGLVLVDNRPPRLDDNHACTPDVLVLRGVRLSEA